MLHHGFRTGDSRRCLFDTCRTSRSESDHRHYHTFHGLKQCYLSSEPRPFGSRPELLEHLVEVHGFPDFKICKITDNIYEWSIKLNTRLNYSLWQCRYCGRIGADWNDRLTHILSHVSTGIYPNVQKTSGKLSNVDISIHDCLQGICFHRIWLSEQWCETQYRWYDYNDFLLYVSIIREAFKSSTRFIENGANPCSADYNDRIIALAQKPTPLRIPLATSVGILPAPADTGDTTAPSLLTLSPKIHEVQQPQPTQSFFTSMKKRTKTFLDFARGRRTVSKKAKPG